jgi:hypothetical protein
MIAEPMRDSATPRATFAPVERPEPEWQLNAASHGLPLGFLAAYAPACRRVKNGSEVSFRTCIAASVSIGAL